MVTWTAYKMVAQKVVSKVLLLVEKTAVMKECSLVEQMAAMMVEM